MRRSPSITGRAAVLPLAILAVLMSCAGGGDGGYPSIFGTWKYEDPYTRWIWDAVYAVSRSGNYLFQYSDMLGGAAMTERIAGDAVAAESYPDCAGTWQHVDAETRWTSVVTGSSFETVIESMNGSWSYAFGMRGDYSLNGDNMDYTLTGGRSGSPRRRERLPAQHASRAAPLRSRPRAAFALPGRHLAARSNYFRPAPRK